MKRGRGPETNRLAIDGHSIARSRLVEVDGPYIEPFVRDVGSLLIAVALVLIYALKVCSSIAHRAAGPFRPAQRPEFCTALLNSELAAPALVDEWLASLDLELTTLRYVA